MINRQATNRTEKQTPRRQSQLPATLDKQFELAVRRLAEDLRFGYDMSPFVGPGLDYVQSRPFVDGDQIRDIDWKRTARSGKFHVKEYESLRSTTVYLLVDTSASMSLSSQRMSKYTLAVLLAGGIGLAAIARLSPAGVLAVGDRDMHFEPSLSRPRVFQWLHELRTCRYDETTQIAAAADRVQGQLKTPALVVVISDLHDPDSVAAIKRLAVRHDCVTIQLQDPAEAGRLRAGFLRGKEAETGRTFVAHGQTRWLDKPSSPGQELKQVGIDHLILSTDQPFVAPLRRFLVDRGGLQRNKR